jgi:hypothetical protein
MPGRKYPQPLTLTPCQSDSDSHIVYKTSSWGNVSSLLLSCFLLIFVVKFGSMALEICDPTWLKILLLASLIIISIAILHKCILVRKILIFKDTGDLSIDSTRAFFINEVTTIKNSDCTKGVLVEQKVSDFFQYTLYLVYDRNGTPDSIFIDSGGAKDAAKEFAERFMRDISKPLEFQQQSGGGAHETEKILR